MFLPIANTEMYIDYQMNKLTLVLRAFSRINNWGDFFLDYLGLKKGYITYQIGNKQLKARAGNVDKKIITEVFLTDKYSVSQLSIKKDDIVVDLGAHIGAFSILVECKVFAVEPSIENFNLLFLNAKLNPNIIPVWGAVSYKNGLINLYRGSNSARHTLIRERGITPGETVPSVTLEHLFKARGITKCKLLKMDIEGAEYSVLYSTPQEIFNKIDNIFLEVHDIPKCNRDNLFEFLEKKGFTLRFDYENFVYASKHT